MMEVASPYPSPMMAGGGSITLMAVASLSR